MTPPRSARALLCLVLLVLLAGCASSAASAGSRSPSRSPARRTPPVPLLSAPAVAKLGTADPTPIGPSPTPRLPVTVHNYGGGSVTVKSDARIVAFDLYGTYGTTVFALGLGSHLVGRDIATDFPAASHIPDVTHNGQDINVESILALHPTVVLTDTTMPEAATGQKQLAAAGIPVVYLNPHRTIGDAPSEIEAVADALGVPAAGRALAARTEAQVAAARAAVPSGSPRPRIAFIYARGPGLLLLGGPGSGADSLIDLIGGVDAGTAAGLKAAFTQATAEGLINLHPGVILMMTGGLRSVGGISGLLKLPGVAETPAGRHHRVISMNDGVLLSFGPRVGEVAQALERALYHDR